MPHANYHCGTCFWFAPTRHRFGECRIKPPQRSQEGVAEWPLVTVGEWCGEHAFDLQPDATGPLDTGQAG